MASALVDAGPAESDATALAQDRIERRHESARTRLDPPTVFALLDDDGQWLLTTMSLESMDDLAATSAAPQSQDPSSSLRLGYLHPPNLEIA